MELRPCNISSLLILNTGRLLNGSLLCFNTIIFSYISYLPFIFFTESVKPASILRRAGSEICQPGGKIGINLSFFFFSIGRIVHIDICHRPSAWRLHYLLPAIVHLYQLAGQ